MPIHDFDTRFNTWLEGLLLFPSERVKRALVEHAQDNATTISTLIECDLFGERSDFNDNPPVPSAWDQISILQAFLLQQPHYKHYDIVAITEMLNSYITEQIPNRVTQLDNRLFNTQLHGIVQPDEVFRIIGHTYRGDPAAYVRIMDTLHILRQMARMLDNLPEADADADADAKASLYDWIETHAQQCLGQDPINSSLDGKDFLLIFLKKETRSFYLLYLDLRRDIMSILSNPFSFDTLHTALLMGMQITLFIAIKALFPLRLLTALFGEMMFLWGKAICHLGMAFPHNRWVMLMDLPTLIAVMDVFLFSLSITNTFLTSLGLMFLGNPYFLLNGSLGTLTDILIDMACEQYVLALQCFIAFVAAKQIHRYVKELQQWGSERFIPFVSSVASRTRDLIETIQARWSQCFTSVQEPALNTEQRTRLQVLLSEELRHHPEIPPQERAALQQERSQLAQHATPYYLTQRDRQLLQSRNIPEELSHFPSLQPHMP